VAISFYPLIKRALKKELRNASEVKLDGKGIIISDVHLLAYISSYSKAHKTLVYTLQHYHNQGYWLGIDGDFLDLWVNNEQKIIQAPHNRKLLELVYKMCKFITLGNHDPKLKLLKKYCNPDIIIAKSLKWNNTLITHGNCGELTEYLSWLGSVSIYAVRFASFLQRKKMLPALPRTANDISRKHCNNLHKAQQELGINLICGHTHNPRIERVIHHVNTANNKLITGSYYANTGCCSFLDGSISFIELDVKNNIPTLVKVDKDLKVEKTYG
jgi:UDP-2,3-diacylglucosamine pyrophosphatase LpxH